MSKAIKKIFKGVKKVVKKTVKFVKKHWKEIVLVGAAVFTAGAALGYVGMNASGGLAFSGFGKAGLGKFGGAIAEKGIGAAFKGLGNTVTQALGMGNKFGGPATQGATSGANATGAVTGAPPAGGAPAPAPTGGSGFPTISGDAGLNQAAQSGALAGNEAATTAATTAAEETAKGGLLKNWDAGTTISAIGAGTQVAAAYGKYREGDEEGFTRDEALSAYPPGQAPVASAQQPGSNAQRGLMQPVRTRRQSTTDRDTVARRTYRGYA